MTARERFLATCRFEPVDVPFVRAIGGWATTMERWRAEGWDGRPLHEVWGTDFIANVGVYYGPAPPYPYRVLEEDDQTRTYVNHEGIVMREFKEHADTSMPHFVKFPVETAADFEEMCAEHLELNFEHRIPKDWEARIAAWMDRDDPLMCFADRWSGYFGSLRNMMGLERLAIAFYDDPALIERMMEQRTEVTIAITERILERVEIDMWAFWEDMASKNGSLIDPAMFRRFALKHYRRVCDFLRSRGVDLIFLDSDGDISELIPIWLDAGINGIWPFEVAAGMDVNEVRRKYGRDLVLIGGIDKRAVAAGGATMRREVDRVLPLVEEGGYLPELDHAAPPDISWANMCEYMEYLMERLGRR